VATEGGYGKRSETGEYRVSHRGGKGIITVKTTAKTGKMVAIREAVERDDVVVVTSGGIVIRQHASEIRLAGRNTQGVRLIKLDPQDTISDVAAVVSEEEEPNGATSGKSATGEEVREGEIEADLSREKKGGSSVKNVPSQKSEVKPEEAKAQTQQGKKDGLASPLPGKQPTKIKGKSKTTPAERKRKKK
jgi:DNA gyrase subunit A